MEREYRANRSFGVMNQGEKVTFEDGDPVLVSLLGTGYLDPVGDSTSIPSGEVVGTPTIVQGPAPKKATKTAAKGAVETDEATT